MISIIYLIQYYINDDPYNCILLSPGPIKYRSELDFILNDNKRNNKRWELEYIVDHKNKQDTI